MIVIYWIKVTFISKLKHAFLPSFKIVSNYSMYRFNFYYNTTVIPHVYVYNATSWQIILKLLLYIIILTMNYMRFHVAIWVIDQYGKRSFIK